MGRKRAIICFETEERFESVTDAANAIGAARPLVSNALKRHVACRGFHFYYADEVKPVSFTKRLPKRQKKPERRRQVSAVPRPVWQVAITGSTSMTDSGWLHYRDLKSRCPTCKRPAHIAKRDGTFYFVDDEYNPFVRHAPVKTTEEVFRFFANGYRREHGAEPEVTGNRKPSERDILSGMGAVSVKIDS